MKGGGKNDLCQLYSTQSSPVKSLNLNIPSPTVETSLVSGNNSSSNNNNNGSNTMQQNGNNNYQD